MLSQRVLDKDGAAPLTCSGIGCHGREERLSGQMGGVVACGVAARQRALLSSQCYWYEEGA